MVEKRVAAKRITYSTQTMQGGCGMVCSLDHYFAGRINQMEYLLGAVFSVFFAIFVTIISVIVLSFLLTGVVAGTLNALYPITVEELALVSSVFIGGFGLFIGFFVFLFFTTSFMTRRVHDMSISGWWVFAWFLLGLILPLFLFNTPSVTIFDYNVGSLLLFNIPIIIIALSFIPGDEGTKNAYGAKPTNRSFWRHCMCCKK